MVNLGLSEVARLEARFRTDVLDKAGKDKLVSGNDKNIVAIDLPHTPAKELGPSEAYAGAGETLCSWLESGDLTRRETPAMFAYRQTFEFRGEKYQRCGMACTVETQPLGPRDGGGILPHEQTFSGPKEDRLALMKATATQISPIFGLRMQFRIELLRGRQVTLCHL